MRLLLSGVLALSTLAWTGLGAALEVAPDASHLAEARQLVRTFASNLKKELKAALKKGGPVTAIETCHLKAPDIAKDLSNTSHWEVRRASLKVRNLEDAPDKWETTVLERFEALNKADAPEEAMEYSEVVPGKNGGRVFRYMKAIPTIRICLKCHGETIDPKVQKQLDSLYPFDQATGFTEDDLRGAFSLSLPLE